MVPDAMTRPARVRRPAPLRAAIYLAKATLIAAGLYCAIYLTGTVLGTLTGILIVEWSQR
ncbi:MAG TPA: hypothetical protein VGK41_00600 [Solirubrobacterales bacterium]